MLKEKLNSRERVLCALAHVEPDRLPRDFDAEPPVIEGLLRHYGLKSLDDLIDHFEIDFFRCGAEYQCPYTDGRNIYGIRYGTSADGKTSNAVNHPLAGAETVADVEAHPWPRPEWVDLEMMQVKTWYGRQRGQFVVCSSRGAVFGETYRLMGMDQFMMALYTKPEVVHAIIRKLTDFYLAVDRRLFEACDGLIDMAFYGNDMGTQQSLFFHPDAFKEYFAGPLKELVDQAKRYGLKTMMHSCGAVSELIPEIIACGFDALDPVQFTAHGMQPQRLKQLYGDRITFHGNISAQRVLPLGSPEEVREHVREVCEAMRPGGGYIFTSDQAITCDSPVENVVAMYDAIRQYRF